MRKDDLIFIIDDDPVYLNFLKLNLFKLGFSNVQTYATGQDYLNNLHQMPKVVLMDYNLEDTTGKQLLSETLTFDPDILVVIISSQKSIESAIETLKIGALDYIKKNDSIENQLVSIFKKVEELYQENGTSAKKLYFTIAGIIGVGVSLSMLLFHTVNA